MKNFRAVLTSNEKQQSCQDTASDTELSVAGKGEEPDETIKPNNNGAWKRDFDSFNFEQTIAEILLELRQNFKTSTAATCFVSEKIKYVLHIDRQIHLKLLIKSLRKDIQHAALPSDIVFSYETNVVISSQSPFSKACHYVRCPNTEFFLVRIRNEYGKIFRISPYSVRMWENKDQKKLRIWTLFRQCIQW